MCVCVLLQDALGMTPFALAVALGQNDLVDAMLECAVTRLLGVSGTTGGDGDVFTEARAPERPGRRGRNAPAPQPDGMFI